MGSSKKDFIEKIRKETFSIGSGKSNPLAGSLHEAIRHLSAELYQKDIHFISELIQHAEDNYYKLQDGVSPELDLVLTRSDITGVGAAATLIPFNNEVGFSENNVSALCGVGQSTKKDQRSKGYIGEKGIGFKSVFVVTSTPYIISNGFRIRFNDSGETSDSTTTVGYIVPQWVDKPTDEELRQFWRPNSSSDKSLPNTIIVLPLRNEKVAPVREELRQISPETILFLRQLKRLQVLEMSFGRRSDNQQQWIMSRTDSPRSQHDEQSAMGFVTELSMTKGPRSMKESCFYFVWEQRFPVTAPVEQRKEVENWFIQLAFPLQYRIASGSSGNVYAFLPSQLNSGLPVLINADFLLVSSRETLKFDSPWNKGIIGCIPKAFCDALAVMLKEHKTEDAFAPVIPAVHVYKYVPSGGCISQLQNVQKDILENLVSLDCNLVDQDVGSGPVSLCKPEKSRRISKTFRRLLKAAVAEQKVPDVIGQGAWYLVHEQVQDSYSAALDLMKVPWMKSDEYLQVLRDTKWLLQVSESLYWDILTFSYELQYGYNSFCSGGLNKQMWDSLNLFKYEDEVGKVHLISISELKRLNISLCRSPPEEGSYLSKWMEQFRAYVQFRFMPWKTIDQLDKLTSSPALNWIMNEASISQIDIAKLATRLINEKVSRDKTQNPYYTVDTKLVLSWFGNSYTHR